MKCVSFNVNSIRTRLHQLQAVIDKHSPDFIGLQETKVTDEDFPVQQIVDMGYHVEFFGQKTHYGVALLSKLPFKSSMKGFVSEAEDAQRRFISGDFELENGEKIAVMNGYFPQGESRDHPVKFPNKQKYYENLYEHLKGINPETSNVIVMGDMNVSPTDDDIGIGDDNKKRWLRTGKCSFLPEEREWLQRIYNLNLVDTFRHLNPDTNDVFSWFDYRSRGFEREPKRGLRIDLILASPNLLSKVSDAGVDYDIRAMEKPSDHCPIWTEFDV